MKRVASLYLPHWSIDRLRRIERRNASPAEGALDPASLEGRTGPLPHPASQAAYPMGGRVGERAGAAPGSAELNRTYDTLCAEAAAERAQHCSVPKEGNWRPGARWAKTDRSQVEAAIEALPAHRRPDQDDGKDGEPDGGPLGNRQADDRLIFRRAQAVGLEEKGQQLRSRNFIQGRFERVDAAGYRRVGFDP